jgi:hypothetical protein
MRSPRHRYRTHAHPRRIRRRPARHLVTATFIDGPEHGLTLRIQRVPKFLRIIHNGIQVAALDQLGMDPEETDIVYAYRRTTGKHRPGIMRATYTYQLPQPRMARIAHPFGWQAWVKEQLPTNRQSGQSRQ